MTMILAIVIACLVVGGCSKKEEPAPTPSETPAEAPKTPPAEKPSVPEKVVDEIQETSATAVETAKETAEDVVAEAKKLLEQATNYLKENNLDAVEPLLAKLDELKASLPESVQKQIESLEKTFGIAKTTGGEVKIPEKLPIKK